MARPSSPVRAAAEKRARTPPPPSLADRWLGPASDYPGPQGLTPDRRASVILWTSAVLVVVLIFKGGFATPGALYQGWSDVDPNSLAGRMYWVAWGVLAYLVIPLAIIRFVMRESPARYGLRVYLSRRTLLAYGVLFAVMLAPIWWAAQQPTFYQQYPMVTDLDGDWSRIWTWEVIRSLRFVCLEFFFRGYLLFGLEKRFGYHAIAVAALPYGVIHYGKPFPEALGAVAAGAVLGFLALRTRSIAGGALLHSLVAAAVDLLSLYRRSLLG